MSEYFDSTQNTVVQGSLAKASHINDLRDEVGVGFDKFPESSALNEGRITLTTDTGAANAYVVAMPTTVTSYITGLHVVMQITNTNTGASTIDVDTIGTKGIKRPDGTDLVAGDLSAGQVVELRYDGTNFRFTGAIPQSVFDDIDTKHDTIVAKEALVNPHYDNIDTVAGINVAVSTVAGIDTDVSTVAAIHADVPLVAAIDTDVSAVAAIDLNITKVADIDLNVTKVADIDTNVTAVADNEVNINKVSAIDLNVTKVADIDSNVTLVADNVAEVVDFNDRYAGELAVAPADPVAGLMYFDTPSEALRVYNGFAWGDVGTGAGGGGWQVNQVAHGFSVLDVIMVNAGTWSKAQSNDEATLGIGIVTNVVDADNFEASMSGHYELTAHGLTVDNYYYLSNDVAGGLTDVEPTNSQPIVFAIDTNNLLILPYRPSTQSVPTEVQQEDVVGTDTTTVINVAYPIGEALVFVNGVRVNFDSGETVYYTVTDTQEITVYGTIVGDAITLYSFALLVFDDHYQPDNILGTVSESAGVPTGSVIERGSNANGEYVKFADGTMICSASHSGWEEPVDTVSNDIPAVFIEIPNVSWNTMPTTNHYMVSAVWSTTTQWFFRHTEASTQEYWLFSIGRWF